MGSLLRNYYASFQLARSRYLEVGVKQWLVYKSNHISGNYDLLWNSLYANAIRSSLRRNKNITFEILPKLQASLLKLYETVTYKKNNR